METMPAKKSVIEVETSRLILRQWQESDFQSFAVMCADPQVMAFFPSVLSVSESHQKARYAQSLIAERGWGFWAVEEKDSGRFVGFVGLHIVSDDMPFAPAVEIGWRLSSSCWGQGYATEAAQAALSVGFDQLELGSIVSFAVEENDKSTAVMKRLGMVYEGGFHHPSFPDGHRLRKHCLYKLSREQWTPSQ